MKRSATFTLTVVLAMLLLAVFAGINYANDQVNDWPFRCSAFSRYELSRQQGEINEFVVSQDLRFVVPHSGYLLLKGQAFYGKEVTIVNRRIVLTNGGKPDNDTYRYHIKSIVTSTNDTTPDAVFNSLLAEITLDPTHLQLDITQIDQKTYLVGGPLSYLFTCQRY